MAFRPVKGGGGIGSILRSPRTADVMLVGADRETLIDITSETFTQTFTAAATLGSGWFCYYRNSGAGTITLDPNAAETIDGAATLAMYPGEARLIQCNGTAFFTIKIAFPGLAITAGKTITVTQDTSLDEAVAMSSKLTGSYASAAEILAGTEAGKAIAPDQLRVVSTGTVANVVAIQTREQGTFAAPNSGDGTVVTPLNLVITPKKAGNLIILEWNVNGEMSLNTVYIVTRNGEKLTDTTDANNNRWAGITAQPYDAQENSTPDNAVVKILDLNSLDVATTYELRVRASGNTSYTLYLNRTGGSTGGDGNETSLSVGIATEIWQ